MEQLERIATDLPFQWVMKKVFHFLAVRAPDTASDTTDIPKAEQDFAVFDEASNYGMPMSEAARNTYNMLRNRGVSRRDLRLAMFCQYIREDGSIHINVWKERLLAICAWTLLAVTTLGCLDLAFRLFDSNINVAWKILVPLLIFGILIALQYPILVLGLRTRSVVKRLQAIFDSTPTA